MGVGDGATGGGERSVTPRVGDPTDTPFWRLALDPWMTPEAITEAMRELAEDAEPEERRRLQGLWRELTLHPEERLELAFFSHAHPAGSLARVDVPGQELVERYGSASSARVPSGLERYRPVVSDLVLLPPVRVQLRGSAEAAWPDVLAAEDPLLRL